jgi:hypothetical protein
MCGDNTSGRIVQSVLKPLSSGMPFFDTLNYRDIRMKMKTKIRILREKITGCLRQMLHFFPLREILFGFPSEKVYCPVKDRMPFLLPEFRLEKNIASGNFFFCHSLKRNTFLCLIGKNNLDTSGCSRFSQFRRLQPIRKNRIFPV